MHLQRHHLPTIITYSSALCVLVILGAPTSAAAVAGRAVRDATTAAPGATNGTTVNPDYNSSKCPDILASRCTCGIRPYMRRSTYVTNCTNAGFHFTPQLYLQQISNETEVLIFTGNNFTELPANLLLLNRTYDKLNTVDLSDNNIHTIHGKAFHNMKMVRILKLNNNNLTIVNPDSDGEGGENESQHPRMFASLKNLDELHLRNAFDHRRKTHGRALMSALSEVFKASNLTNLKVLNLERNGISTLGNDSFFCVLPSLQNIYLSYNSLTRYPIDASCLKWLSNIDVSANFITSVDNRSIELIKSPGARVGKLHLNISSNPFRCDCSLLDFFRFVQNSTSKSADPHTSPKLENMDKFKCSAATNTGHMNTDIMGKYFDDLSEQDFNCGPDQAMLAEKSEAIRRYNHYITLSYCILVFLLILLAFLIGVLVYTNRDFLLNTWNYFLVELNPKSDYTALDKDVPAGPSAANGKSGAPGETSHLGSATRHQKKTKRAAKQQRLHMRMHEEADENAVAEDQV